MTDFKVWKLNPSLPSEPPGNDKVKAGTQKSLNSALQVGIKAEETFRSLVYLHICAERHDETQNKTPYMYGAISGWLIAPDIVVTSGHCIGGMKENGRGKAVSVTAYIGYLPGKWTSKDPLETIFQEKRQGSVVVAPTRWCDDNDPAYEVAFVQLAEPFVHAKPMNYEATPGYSKLRTDGHMFLLGFPGHGGTYEADFMGQPFCSKVTCYTPAPKFESDGTPPSGWESRLHLTGYGFPGMSGGPIVWVQSQPKSDEVFNSNIIKNGVGIGTLIGGNLDHLLVSASVIGTRGGIENNYSHYVDLLNYVAQSPDERVSEDGVVYRRRNNDSFEVVS